MTDDHSPRGGDTREKIKQAARRLFAERGIDAVSIRDITKAAGQKNAGSVNYYFRSKEALIGELIADVAAIVEVERNRRVDAMEAAGGPHDMREVLAVLIDLSPLEDEVAPIGEDAIRFMKRVMASHSELLFEAIHFDLDTATRRCVAHLRRLMPAMPPVVVGLRIRLAMLLAFAGLSSREAAVVSPDLWPAGWTAPVADANLIDALEGLLTQPPSAEAINLTE
ncbi:TetR/AcrR family transcriptional regulator [Zavarzinia sp.]|uniref:TetR/AcrR family transcriptional regulator n=1 Tax=Zavarzinia sp. TaxID=2027920 RepID=UPI003567DA22